MNEDNKNTQLIEYEDWEALRKRFDEALTKVSTKYYERDKGKLKVAYELLSLVLTVLLSWQVALLGIPFVLVNLVLITALTYMSIQASAEIVLKLYAIYVKREIRKLLDE